MPPTLELVWPSNEYLPGYVAALARGWSADNVRGLVGGDAQFSGRSRQHGGGL